VPSADRLHPSEKPSGLMGALLTAHPSGCVLDPFMGSGATLVAARHLGYPAIGIEIDEGCCEIAANRLRQYQPPLELPA
jgi:site-specific DNA-methyltransferase (adenine-specific)